MRSWRRREAWLLAIVALAVGGVLAACDRPGPSGRVDVAAVARRWTTDFSVRGMKTEPTFIEQVQYTRAGDRFSLDASIHGQAVGQLALDLAADGEVTLVACPTTSGCPDLPPNGFLSTVAALAALRAGRLAGQGELAAFAGRDVVCVPLEQIQPRLTSPAVMDPCFDVATGAVLAHRRRFDHQFGGATLDESSVRLTRAPFGETLTLNPSFRK